MYDPNKFVPHIPGGRSWEGDHRTGRWVDSEGRPLDPQATKDRYDEFIKGITAERDLLVEAQAKNWGVTAPASAETVDSVIAELKAEIERLKANQKAPEVPYGNPDMLQSKEIPVDRNDKVAWCRTRGAEVKGNISNVDLDTLCQSLVDAEVK